jgi:hypothetical protein
LYNITSNVKNKINYIDLPLLRYRISENQISKKNHNEQYFYSVRNRNFYINFFFKGINIEINRKEAFNEILNLDISRKDKEIYLSAYMIFNDVTDIMKLIKFIFRKNFFSYISEHKFYIHFLMQKSKNAKIK